MESYLLWLFAGVAFLAAEALGITGVGLLFAGLGALTTGSIVTAVPTLTPLEQWLVFLSSTALWVVFLWKPLQKFRGTGSENQYRNIVGDTVFIGAGGLQKDMTGEATWSGTIMRAQLAEDAAPIAAGAQATVVAVAGNTLIVKPRQ